MSICRKDQGKDIVRYCVFHALIQDFFIFDLIVDSSRLIKKFCFQCIIKCANNYRLTINQVNNQINSSN